MIESLCITTGPRRGPPKSHSPPDDAQIDHQLPLPSNSLADDDHIAELAKHVLRITELDTEMTDLDTQLDRIDAKLSDPDLLEQIPDGHPDRLAAIDAYLQIDEQLTRCRHELTYNACVIDSHGRYMTADELDQVGRNLDLDGPVLSRIASDVPGILTSETMQTLTAAACPF